jgi:hypothetical protein
MRTAEKDHVRVVLCLGLVQAALVAPTQPVTAQSSVRIWLENEYVAHINLGFAKADRAGADTVEGVLQLQADGTWSGEVRAKINFEQEMKGLGISCPKERFVGSQRLEVSTRSVGGFNQTSQTITYRTGRPSGFMALAVKPLEPPTVSGTAECLTLYQDDRSPFPLLPLNDARWNQPASGYIVGLPSSGVLEYDDLTAWTAAGPEASLRSPARGNSQWKIRVERD